MRQTGAVVIPSEIGRMSSCTAGAGSHVFPDLLIRGGPPKPLSDHEHGRLNPLSAQPPGEQRGVSPVNDQGTQGYRGLFGGHPRDA